jgi:branched-chain amino acid transport system substrate-binding protein
MVKQMSELGIKAKFMGGDGMQTPNFIKLAGPASEGVMASIPGLPKEKMPGGQQFLDKYKGQVQPGRRALRADGLRRGDGVHRRDEARRARPTRRSSCRSCRRRTTRASSAPIAFDDKGDL